MKTIEYDCQCTACKGTGIYVGMAERDGFGVVCYNCKGTGKVEVKLSYEPFTKRIKKQSIHTVLESNPGICIGGTFHDFGGIPYDEWIKGKRFKTGSEMRKHTCPSWWYQSADSKRKPQWDDCGFGMFSACDSFGQKHKCWERFDEEGL